MKSRVWLSSPHMSGNELKYINEAFDANWIAPLGPNVDGFEKDLEKFLNEKVKVAALSSGTAALHLALVECNVGYGDEVICQSMTFSASANPMDLMLLIKIGIIPEAAHKPVSNSLPSGESSSKLARDIALSRLK